MSYQASQRQDGFNQSHPGPLRYSTHPYSEVRSLHKEMVQTMHHLWVDSISSPQSTATTLRSLAGNKDFSSMADVKLRMEGYDRYLRVALAWSKSSHLFSASQYSNIDEVHKIRPPQGVSPPGTK